MGGPEEMEALQGHSAVGFDLGRDRTGVAVGPIAVLWGPREEAFV